jgi:hypothetical protein
VQHLDVDPADMVGHEQHRPVERPAVALQAEAEHPHQPAGPQAHGQLFQRLAVDPQPAPRRHHRQQRQRQHQHDVQQQQRQAVQVADHAHHATSRSRRRRVAAR